MRKKLGKWLIWLGILPFAALIGCAQTPYPLSGPVTVAVWTLDNHSLSANTLLGIEDMLTNEVLNVFRESSRYQLIEREELLKIIEELHLGSSELAQESTRLRLGKLLGAQTMVFGSFQVVGKRMRLDLRLVEVATGRILRVSEKTVPSLELSQWAAAAREAAQELL